MPDPVVAPPAPSSPSPAPSPGSVNGVDAAISAFMNFDAFAEELPEGPSVSPPAEPTAPLSGQEPPPAVPAPGGDGGEGPQPPVSPTLTPAAPSPEILELRAQLGTLERLMQGGGQPAAAEPPTDDTPSYMLRIPDEIIAGMESEDPKVRRDALGLLVAGIGRTVHRTIMERVGQQFQQIPQMISQIHSATSTRKQVFDEFYGQYKDLNQKHFYPLVQEAAKQVMAETKANAWTPVLSKAIAIRAYQLLGRPVPGAPVVAARPPVQVGGGSRPASSLAGTPALEQELRDILF